MQTASHQEQEATQQEQPRGRHYKQQEQPRQNFTHDACLQSSLPSVSRQLRPGPPEYLHRLPSQGTSILTDVVRRVRSRIPEARRWARPS